MFVPQAGTMVQCASLICYRPVKAATGIRGFLNNKRQGFEHGQAIGMGYIDTRLIGWQFGPMAVNGSSVVTPPR